MRRRFFLLYNEEAFNISSDYYSELLKNTNEVSNDIKKKQDELLKILLKKFKSELLKEKDLKTGILRVRFLHKYSCMFNDGYYEIAELVNSGNFDDFASQYGIFIGEFNNNCSEYNDGYYEIIWDYKSYFEQFNNANKKEVK
jgi:hypothetical protein